MTKVEKIDAICEVLNRIPELRNLDRRSDVFQHWKRDAVVAIESAFPGRPDDVNEFKAIRHEISVYSPPLPGRPGTGTSAADHSKAYNQGLDRAEGILRSMLKQLMLATEESANPSETSEMVKKAKQDRFFVGYNEQDKDWASRLSVWLKNLGHDVIVQSTDFSPGSNFVLKMHGALQGGRVIAVLSPI